MDTIIFLPQIAVKAFSASNKNVNTDPISNVKSLYLCTHICDLSYRLVTQNMGRDDIRLAPFDVFQV
jgi:hypothetical protein